MSAGPRIAVTGIAASTCCGVGARAFLDRLCGDGGEPGPQRGFPPIDVDISAGVRTTRTEDEPTRHLLGAVAADLAPRLEAMAETERLHAGIVLGNPSGSVEPYGRFFTAGVRDGYERVNPAHLPTTLVNYQAAALSHALGLMGQCTTLSGSSSAGLDAIAQAAQRVRLGRERALLAGGIQVLSRADCEALRGGGLLSPSGRVRPFHAKRDGTVPAEAVGLLMLEAGRDGQGAPAEIAGWAWGHDGDAEAVMRKALKAGGVPAEAVDLVFPSANGTLEGDDREAAALRRVFGDRAETVGLCPVAPVAGDCLAAAGALQCIAAVHALRGGPVPARPLDAWVRGEPAAGAVTEPRAVLVYSLSREGSASAVVLRRG